MGQWTRHADVGAMLADLGDDRARLTVRKRVPHSSLILARDSGTWDVVAVESTAAGAAMGTDDRILRAIAAGADQADAIRTALGSPDRPLPKRTFYNALGRLRHDGLVGEGTPLSPTDAGREAVG